MKISEVITDKYKLRIPPTVYYDLLADVVEAEEEQEPKTGHWIKAKPWMIDNTSYKWECSECEKSERFRHNYCPNCGCQMVEPQEGSE